MAARSRLLAAAAVAALLLAGCGQAQKSSTDKFQGEQKAVAQTIEDLQKAGKDRDANKICEQLLAPSLVSKIEQAGNGDCSKVLDDALADADTFELTVEKVTINGTRATAVVKSEAGDKDRTDSLVLEKAGSSWKIASLGDTAGGASPSS
jgi:PBP1b-binding outer membrane lipoprotein LpoB